MIEKDDGKWKGRNGLIDYEEMCIAQIKYALGTLKDMSESTRSSQGQKEWALNKYLAIKQELIGRGHLYVDGYSRYREGRDEEVSSYIRVGKNPSKIKYN